MLRAGLPLQFDSVLEAQGVHTKHNVDQLTTAQGAALCATLRLKQQQLELQALAERRQMYASSFLPPLPCESELDFHNRLVVHVNRALGCVRGPSAAQGESEQCVGGGSPVVSACYCGSRRYNLQLPGSDHDIVIVYAARDSSNTIAAAIKNPAGCSPDYTGRVVLVLSVAWCLC